MDKRYTKSIFQVDGVARVGAGDDRLSGIHLYAPTRWRNRVIEMETHRRTGASYYCSQRISSDSDSTKFDKYVTTNAEDGPADIGSDKGG